MGSYVDTIANNQASMRAYKNEVVNDDVGTNGYIFGRQNDREFIDRDIIASASETRPAFHISQYNGVDYAQITAFT